MKIESLAMSDQLKMIKGVESISPKVNSVNPNGNTQKQSFGDFLTKQMQEVNQLGLESDRAIQRSVTGEELNPHNTLLAITKADISFRLMMSVKEKLEQAYQQIVRTQI
jgi:flagellar hook-basal body complex protein FliE